MFSQLFVHRGGGGGKVDPVQILPGVPGPVGGGGGTSP